MVAADGFTYERECIVAWIAKAANSKCGGARSPLTGELLSSTCVFPNHVLRSQIRAYLENAIAVDDVEVDTPGADDEGDGE